MKRLFQNPLTYYALFIAAIACAERCYADVCLDLTCSTAKPPAQMQGSDTVYWCDGTVTNGTCPAVKASTWSQMATWTKILTDSGYYTKDKIPTAAPPPSTYTLSPLSCYDAKNRHWKIDSSLRVLIVAWCRQPDHIHRSARLYKPFTLANAQEINSDGDTAEAKRLDAKYTNQALSAADEAYVLAWAKPYEPIVVVAKNGTSKTRPVYPRNADGTQGTKSVGTVLVGAPCDYRSSIKDADYFAVPGGFALCTVSNFVK